MPEKLIEPLFRPLLACPVPTCRSAQLVEEETDFVCQACGERFALKGTTLDFTPANWKSSLNRWGTWEKLQANGMASYTQAPEQNLGVGRRADCLAFSRFCDLRGLVLDIGCGPQAWPAYFAEYHPDTRFIGIDPLLPLQSVNYPRVCGLGEYLPFQNGVFDRTLFATSLDHMLDPVAVLKEARRVTKPEGHVILWSGEKKSGAPRPKVSPSWYRELQVPEGAEDPFHFRRFPEDEVQEYIGQAALSIVEHQAMPIDDWRTNHFYRLSAA
jgi:SAM-dependent methyltransferase